MYQSQVCWEVESVYCSRRALRHIQVVLMVCSPIIYICAGICGRAICRDDLWSSLYSMREET